MGSNSATPTRQVPPTGRRGNRGRGSCQPIGTFTSDDHATALTDARLTVTSPFGSERKNTVLRATWQGKRHPVAIYREEGSIDWIYVVAFSALGLTSAVWVLLCAVDACLRIYERPRT